MKSAHQLRQRVVGVVAVRVVVACCKSKRSQIRVTMSHGEERASEAEQRQLVFMVTKLHESGASRATASTLPAARSQQHTAIQMR
jgi:hypothetical protein